MIDDDSPVTLIFQQNYTPLHYSANVQHCLLYYY
jgi:hypothetical protein